MRCIWRRLPGWSCKSKAARDAQLAHKCKSQPAADWKTALVRIGGMRILVVGAGALGGYYGARLLAAGRDVTFLVRPGTTALLQRNGLNVLSTLRGDLHLPPPPMVSTGAPLGIYDLILLGPKAYDLASTMQACAPAVGTQTAILPVLNGLAHMAALDAKFGAQHVLGGTCFLSAMRSQDGTIRGLNHTDLLHFGERAPHTVENLQAMEAALCGAGFDCVLRENIAQDQWDKWVGIATMAGTTGLMRATIGEVMAADGEWFALGVLREACSVAAAEGFATGPESMTRLRGILTQPGSKLHASLLRDLEDGAPIERQQIVGDLLERGLRHGLELPLLKVVDTNLRCYEVRRERTAG